MIREKPPGIRPLSFLESGKTKRSNSKIISTRSNPLIQKIGSREPRSRRQGSNTVWKSCPLMKSRTSAKTSWMVLCVHSRLRDLHLDPLQSLVTTRSGQDPQEKAAGLVEIEQLSRRVETPEIIRRPDNQRVSATSHQVEVSLENRHNADP
jgi:hypothetical protein